MHKIILLLVLSVSLIGCSVGIATYCQKPQSTKYDFSFEKGFLPNQYYLKVINRSDRDLQFHAGEKAYYLVLSDGGKYYLDTKHFNAIGLKGVYWFTPGQKGSIPFNIPTVIVRKAKEVIFNGETCMSHNNGLYKGFYERRGLIVTVNLETNVVSFLESSIIDDQPVSLTFSNDEDLGNNFLRKEDFSRFRLKYGEGPEFNNLDRVVK